MQSMSVSVWVCVYVKSATMAGCCGWYKYNYNKNNNRFTLFFCAGSLSSLLLLPGSLLVAHSLLVCVCLYVCVRIRSCFRIFSKCTAQKCTTKQEEITAVAVYSSTTTTTHTHAQQSHRHSLTHDGISYPHHLHGPPICFYRSRARD